MSKILTGAEILNATFPAPVPVDVPGHGTVYVRTLRSGERDRFDAANYEIGPDGKPSLKLGDVSARLVCLCACDERGVRLFTDDNLAQLNDAPASLVEPLYQAAARANGIGKAAAEQAAKN